MKKVTGLRLFYWLKSRHVTHIVNSYRYGISKNKQWSTKHIHKAKDRVTRTPLITMSELRCPGGVSSSWCTRRVSIVTNPVISDEWGKCLHTSILLWKESWPLWNICVKNYHGYVPLVVNTFLIHHLSPDL
jgi:hypothetical protein